MKTLALLLALAAFSWRLDVAPQEQDIQNIRRHYNHINNNLRRYSQVERELMDRSTEGGALDAYFAGSSPRKIVVSLYGCSLQVHKEFYFWNNRLVFVDEVTLRYQSLASPQVLSREENRFYFVHGRLLRWLDHDKKQVKEKGQVAQQERALLQSANEWLTMAQAARRAGPQPNLTKDAVGVLPHGAVLLEKI